MNIHEITIEDIEVPLQRSLRGDLTRLMDAIDRDTLLHPITLRADTIFKDGKSRDGYLLIAGLHRLESCRRLGHEIIPSQVLTVEQVEARIVEIQENLARYNLSDIDEGERRWESAYDPQETFGPERRARLMRRFPILCFC